MKQDTDKLTLAIKEVAWQHVDDLSDIEIWEGPPRGAAQSFSPFRADALYPPPLGRFRTATQPPGLAWESLATTTLCSRRSSDRGSASIRSSPTPNWSLTH